jgi:hypothetical protein
VADDLADAAPATASVRLGETGTRLVLPVIPDETRPRPVFAEPEAADEHPGIRTWGDMVPVRWTTQRDDTGAVSVAWRGCTGAEFSWGKVVDEEYLRYEVTDDDPAGASAHGESRTEVQLADRLLVFRSVLDLDGDAESFRYRFRRELRRDGVLIRERDWQRRFRRDGH